MKAESFIKIDEIQVQCNIQIEQIKSLSIREKINSHTVVEMSAGIEAGSLQIASQQLHSQPLVINIVKNGKKVLLFSGVISQIYIDKTSIYESIHIKAYSLSWLMDLERKSRSYQGDTSILDLIQKIGKENFFSMVCSVQDKMTVQPFIQYRETDWEFLLRLSSHLHAPLYAANDYEGKGFYLGIQEQGIILPINPVSEKWCMDTEGARSVNFDVKRAVYYEVTTSQIFHLGQSIQYQNEELWPFEVNIVLQHGILYCTSRLAGSIYYKMPIIYNPYIKGVALKGTVLQRQKETVKIHLDIDDEQKIDCAYDYPWLPEYGNLFYCMPEMGSRIRLLISGEDERTGIGINSAGWNGKNCKEMQTPENRWFSTEQNKKLIMNPSVMELSGNEGNSKILFGDNTGESIISDRDILIQAKGKITMNGTKVFMNAPGEITAIKRELGNPAVVNICHNLDAMGKRTTFHNLEELKLHTASGNGKNRSVQQKLSKEQEVAEEEKRKKMRFELQKLLKQEKEKYDYELGDTIVKVISAIPQYVEQDELSRIAVGFRPIAGRMKGE